ncbi:uncharacterized protein BKA78DRAFT_308923 [Phyllosticta capitalensis]|uniref:uncharacterized protein n=1 Tax=Phyllosticta capitalensis TaxID=121624 RepID=UPI003130C562
MHCLQLVSKHRSLLAGVVRGGTSCHAYFVLVGLHQLVMVVKFSSNLLMQAYVMVVS